MRRWELFVGAMAVVCGLAAPTQAQDDVTGADVRCVALSAIAATQPNLRGGATISALYFIGRLDGRAPGLNLEAALRSEIPRLSKETLSSEANRCAAILAARGAALQEIGKHLQELGLQPQT